jgi:hypothetical protein
MRIVKEKHQASRSRKEKVQPVIKMKEDKVGTKTKTAERDRE